MTSLTFIAILPRACLFTSTFHPRKQNGIGVKHFAIFGVSMLHQLYAHSTALTETNPIAPNC